MKMRKDFTEFCEDEDAFDEFKRECAFRRAYDCLKLTAYDQHLLHGFFKKSQEDCCTCLGKECFYKKECDRLRRVLSELEVMGCVEQVGELSGYKVFKVKSKNETRGRYDGLPSCDHVTIGEYTRRCIRCGEVAGIKKKK